MIEAVVLDFDGTIIDTEKAGTAAWQHPRFHRGDGGQSGLVLFENGVKYAAG